MPKLEAVKIDLNDAQQQELEQLLRRTSTPQQIALRAKIILRAAAGLSNGKIAQESSMAAAVVGMVSDRSSSVRKT